MERRALLRASDADREAVAGRLRGATAEGRLLAGELEERLTSLYAARTYQELEALVADLPAPDPAPPAPRQRSAGVLVRPVVAGAAAVAALLTVMMALLARAGQHTSVAAVPRRPGDLLVVPTVPHSTAVALDVGPLIVAMLLVVVLGAVVALVAVRSGARRRRLNA